MYWMRVNRWKQTQKWCTAQFTICRLLHSQSHNRRIQWNLVPSYFNREWTCQIILEIVWGHNFHFWEKKLWNQKQTPQNNNTPVPKAAASCHVRLFGPEFCSGSEVQKRTSAPNSHCSVRRGNFISQHKYLAHFFKGNFDKLSNVIYMHLIIWMF